MLLNVSYYSRKFNLRFKNHNFFFAYAWNYIATKDGNTERYVQNLRTTYVAP